MAKYTCTICGFIYEEADGIPENDIAPGTKWEQLPDDWVCPLCGATKDEFEKEEEAPSAEIKPTTPAFHSSADMKEMSPLELSALCNNLARGCEKQYKFEEADLFKQLAIYFKKSSAPAKEPNYDGLAKLIEKDLKENLPNANTIANDSNDRGALRALVWSEKVTRILNSILIRYQNKGDEMLENTGVYVCTICGFVYIGDNLPEVCPVCKVPNWKFEKVEGGINND